MADAYLQRRADAVTTDGSRGRFASTPVPMTEAAAENLAGDLTALQHTGRALEKVNGGYGRADVSVTPVESSVSGDTATLVATEDARLYYPNPQEGTPAYEEYSSPHTLTFTRSAEGWRLAGDQAQTETSSLRPITQIAQIAQIAQIPSITQITGPIGGRGGTPVAVVVTTTNAVMGQQTKQLDPYQGRFTLV
ncbi:hypothetical protein ABT236_35805 [Streptomyces sp. NPDC001523]|uniref:hypothetical protein n=1 Tax=Streptomyces sp. NPDC001523 TaxID=3154383 RepID=UPI00332A52A8